MRFKKIFAFTLAEVLITLSILGVVAAITVPSLIKRQHRNEVETRLKKIFSAMSNAYDTSVAENGPVERWTIDSSITDYDNMTIARANKYLIPYLNVVGDIPTTPVKKWDVKNPKTGNNAGEQGWWDKSSSTYQLKDGMTFGVGPNPWATTGDIAFIRVDINGAKGPNVSGKDNFVFALGETSYCGAQPHGLSFCDITTSRTQLLADCANGRNHFFCSALIGLNHFKIPSDYPWL